MSEVGGDWMYGTTVWTKNLEGELPEVDFFLGTGEYHRFGEILRGRNITQRSFVDTPMYIHDEFAKRVPSWKPHSAYLKIPGLQPSVCICIIPTLRGKLRSRTIPSLVTEAEQLVSQGVKEINLVSPDSTAYGRDLKNGSDLGALLRALTPIDGLEWIRLHYAYPLGLPESLLRAIVEEEKVCSYIDIPLQHASGPMLKRMRRGVTRAGQERILERIKSFVPDVAIGQPSSLVFLGKLKRTSISSKTLYKNNDLTVLVSLRTFKKMVRKLQRWTNRLTMM